MLWNGYGAAQQSPKGSRAAAEQAVSSSWHPNSCLSHPTSSSPSTPLPRHCSKQVVMCNKHTNNCSYCLLFTSQVRCSSICITCSCESQLVQEIIRITLSLWRIKYINSCLFISLHTPPSHTIPGISQWKRRGEQKQSEAAGRNNKQAS